MSRKYPEFELQAQICQWLDYQHPNVEYMSDTVAFLKLTMPQAIRNKKIQKAGFKCPDLILFEPRGEYHGMFIELKVTTPWKKNGDLKKSDHLAGQWKTILALRERGYWADFSWGFERTTELINKYLKL